MTKELIESSADEIVEQIEENFIENLERALARIGADEALAIKSSFILGGERGENPRWLITRNPTPLIKTGALMNSFNSGVEKVDDENYVVVIGTEIEYAEKHDQGIGFPRRRFMFFSNDDKDYINKILVEEVGADT